MKARLIAALAAVACIAAASDPAERLGDHAKEARARALFQEIRCLVCQGESIDDSDADLAKDLRAIVRGQIAAGRSDADVRAYLRARYGDFVLLRPPFSLGNALLWGAPLLVVAAGASLFILRQRTQATPVLLSASEEAELDVLVFTEINGRQKAGNRLQESPDDDGKVT